MDAEGSTDDVSESSNGTFPKSTVKKVDEIVPEKEDKLVSRARCLFLIVLLCAAAALATVVYIVSRNKEAADFEAQFHDVANEVLKSSNENMKQKFKSLESLAIVFTSHSKEQSGNGYPPGFVTVPDTNFYMENARQLGDYLLIGYNPLVEIADYYLWSEYVKGNIGWLEKANMAIGNPPANVSLISPFIYSMKLYNSTDGTEIPRPTDAKKCASNSIELESVEVSRRPAFEIPQDGPFLPVWQSIPAPPPQFINVNMLRDPIYQQTLQVIQSSRKTTFFDVCSTSDPVAGGFGTDNDFTLVVAPVFGGFENTSAIVGILSAVTPWRGTFDNILVQGTPPVLVIMENSCGKTFSVIIQGNDASILSGTTEQPEEFNHLAMSAPFAEFAYPASDEEQSLGECIYTITVHPTEEFESSFVTTKPTWYALVVLAVFVFTSLAFFVFDWLVQIRQKKLVTTAKKQNALVSSLFPKNIKQQLMEEVEEEPRKNVIGKAGIKSYLGDRASENSGKNQYGNTKPIADLFPDCTVMFADISGFTAWSSAREPSHVFALLEAIYKEFDTIARKKGVFKVEVVGDCYVAVCGLPDPRPNHAVVMAKFANSCHTAMSQVTQALGIELGPETCNLKLRVGLHSGSVVAGVLRGEKSRFQLFGDTMNTASRMESTSLPNRIQVSQETAKLLEKAGKSHWMVPREGKVHAKGKGELKTFFLRLQTEETVCTKVSEVPSLTTGSDVTPIPVATESLEEGARQAKWVVEILSNALTDIEINRQVLNIKRESDHILVYLEQASHHTLPINKVEEIIELPEYNRNNQETHDTKLNDCVEKELALYVQTIQCLYNDHPFHSFRHATNVLFAADRFLSQIIATETDDMSEKNFHDQTYGICSDPLTRFSLLFSALIHDCDHPGVPNTQLVKEAAPVAELYDLKAVAEQHSFVIAWDLLLEPAFKKLREAIYANSSEFKRFKQLVTNIVMATDIMDNDLKKLRNYRWDVAFNETDTSKATQSEINRKATAVIEHLIQASDVAHTMQHWQLYRFWNSKYFKECYLAYKAGRAEINPADYWYKGELDFFDFYIIPLAKKLKDCGVFGVSGDKYMADALENRKEWEAKGETIILEMIRATSEAEAEKNAHNIALPGE
ncbi:adenylate/guanylate cyclase [Nitzschia inconspicua]|uniref:Adenylate/guanylate cyclase n=1 Tax=Nitzschia inconspicua TaxID=303405 RepID=A0A9K3KWH7_9STRA|nr:adenylate/guanylate cyclase [Nitzschia inconspicua]